MKMNAYPLTPAHRCPKECGGARILPRIAPIARGDAPGSHGHGSCCPFACAPKARPRRTLGSFPQFEVLCDDDREALSRHYENLSAKDLRLRFGTAVSRAWLAGYVDTFFSRPGVSVGVLQDGICIALGEMRPGNDAPDDRCDIALSVHFGFRGHGLGASMLSQLLAPAASSGFKHARLLVEAENMAMRRVCAKLDASANRCGHQILYTIPTTSDGHSPGYLEARAVIDGIGAN